MMEEGAPASPPDPLTKLRGIVDAFPGQGFAVIDGGHFPDLPADFRRARLFARSLFLDSADPEVQAAGPWLVKLGQAPDATDKVFALVGEKPAAVFWCCDAGEMVLWRHLRGLNVARIPKWAAEGGTAPPAEDLSLEPTPVIFRHWDPRVLGALLPCLEAAQFSRVLGPAQEIAFLTMDYGGVRRVLSDAAFPSANRGMLEIRSDQMGPLGSRRLDASNRRISAYLRHFASDQTNEVDDRTMLSIVQERRQEALVFGLQAESAIGMWCYMRITNKVDLSRDPHVTRFMTSPRNGATAEDRLWNMAELRRNLLEARLG